MGRIYSVPIQLTAVTTQVDLIDIAPADDKPVKLHAIYLGQSTELGDAAEEQLGIQVIRGLATVGSGGASATPTPVGSTADAAAGATVRTLDTTIAVVGGGTTVQMHADTWNIRGPYVMIWTPETRPGASQADTRIVVRTTGAPADSVTICGTVYFEEM